MAWDVAIIMGEDLERARERVLRQDYQAPKFYVKRRNAIKFIAI